jgi:8-oxo-dGTP pyrophosphatase MutT (NUDIX family)
MHRKKLISLLEDYNTPTFEEELYRKKILSFIHQYADCFERSLAVGHITASAWLINKDHSKALLMHHKKLDIWVQPGGHCDGNSDVLSVALKEAQEESGIQAIEPLSLSIFDIDIHPIPAIKKEPAHYHYDIRFLLHTTSDEPFVQNKESKALKWFDLNEPLPTKEQSVLRMHKKWIEKYR